MDFHSLARRDLQSLCKKNRVPANLTNAAMVKALEALETVEGIEEIQEALGFQSPKVKSPKLPQAGRRTSSRGVTHGDEPKIQQQPSPLPQSHGVTVKTLEVAEMASKEEEIQETLGFQSLKVNSPELPRTGRRTSVRRAALGEEPKIQQQKPLHRSRRAAAKDLEVTEMASKEEEVEKKDVPTIFPKTPATRKAVKGVGAHSSRRRAKKNEEVEDHTETPKAVEAKGGKAIGVVTRRITRLSSRKEMEETTTTQSKSRSSSRENAAFKMEALAKGDTVEKEKEEEKKDLVEYGDSSAVIVEEHGKKDQEAKNHELYPSIDGDVPMIQQKQLSKRTQSRRVTTKAQEATKIVSEEENDKKVPKLLHISRQSTRVSSKKPVEEKSRGDGIFKMVALTEEDGEKKQEKEEEKKDLDEKNDSCVVVPVDKDEENDQKVESHTYSSFIEMENKEFIVALVEEVEENNEEVEIHDFSSSIEGKDLNTEVENDDSIVVFVEGDKMKYQKVEIKEYSSSIEVENGYSIAALVDEVEEKKNLAEKSDSCAVTPIEEDVENDQKVKSHVYSSFIEMENRKSIVALVEEDEENDQEVEIHDFTSSTQGKDSNIEVKNNDSIVVFVEGDKMKEQNVESKEYSSFIEVENGDSIAALVDEKDLAEKKDSCVVAPVEEDAKKNQKVESHAYSSFIEMENRESIVTLIEEVKENDQEIEIHDFSSSTQGKDSNIDAENDDSIVVFVEGDKMKDQKVENQEYSYSIAALVDEVEEKKDLTEKRDSFVVAPMEEDAIEKDKKVESHAYSSFIEMKNRESIVAFVEEVKENDQEVEVHDDFSSSAQGKDSNIEVENDDSIILFVEGDKMKVKKVESQEYFSSIEIENGDSIAALVDEVEENDQQMKIHGFSSSAQRVDSNIEVQNDDSTVVLVKEGEMKDQRVEIYDFSFSIEVENGNSIIALVEKDEENDQEEEIHGFSFSSPKEDSNIEVDEAFEFTKDSGNQSPENKAVEYCGDQSPENDLVEDSGNQGSEFVEVEVSDDLLPTNETVEDYLLPTNETVEDSSNADLDSLLCSELRPLPHKEAIVCSHGSAGIEQEERRKLSLLPTDEAVEDSGDHFSNAGLDSLLCSELRPLPHEEAIVCSQRSGGIEEEEERLISLLFTEMTLKELDESNDASFVSKNLPAAIMIRQDDCSSPETSLNKIPCESETMFLIEPSMVQTQSSEEAGGMAATEIEEEKEEAKIKALEEEVFLKDENLELFSLTKLRAMYKQMLNGTKNEQERKKSIIKQEDLGYSSCIKHDENCKKLNDDMIKLRKSPLSRSKLDSNCKQKLNDDKIKPERKRTPLKNLNYSTF